MKDESLKRRGAGEKHLEIKCLFWIIPASVLSPE